MTDRVAVEGEAEPRMAAIGRVRSPLRSETGTFRSAERRTSAFVQMLRRDRIAVAALFIIVIIIIFALLAPVLPLASPTKAKFSVKLLPPAVVLAAVPVPGVQR